MGAFQWACLHFRFQPISLQNGPARTGSGTATGGSSSSSPTGGSVTIVTAPQSERLQEVSDHSSTDDAVKCSRHLGSGDAPSRPEKRNPCETFSLVALVVWYPRNKRFNVTIITYRYSCTIVTPSAPKFSPRFDDVPLYVAPAIDGRLRLRDSTT